METHALPAEVRRLSREKIEAELKNCARLPSLSSVSDALRELLQADHRYTTQVAEVIRRDPSLTARLLRLVNSVYYGLTTSVNSIEEAVFYLGVHQIRQLSMVTPIIEDLQKLTGNTRFPWRSFWQHCIGTAILTREILGADRSQDEVDYVAGLIHDVGIIAMAASFPLHFREIHRIRPHSNLSLIRLEREVLGMDHAEMGGLYLWNHHLPEVMVQTARWHHEPQKAQSNHVIVAAVQIADLLVQHAGIGHTTDLVQIKEKDWLNAAGWRVLFPNERDQDEEMLTKANLRRSLDRLPLVLDGLV